ncbi:TlpA family protein disulfide reductase [Chloroflexota bacterium]
MTKVTVVLALTLITVVLVGLAGCSSATTPPEVPATAQVPNPDPPQEIAVADVGPQVGKLAPDFTFTDPDGKSVSLSSLRGRSVMLNFWATWCGPCRYEMPLIQDLAYDKEKAEAGLILLTVNSGESADTVLKFMKENGFSFLVLLDIQKGITRSYNVRGIPTTFFIGRDGIISEIKIGAFMNETQLKQSLNKVIR